MTSLALIDGWPPAARAAGVLVDGELVDDRGDARTPLRWASVTKLVTGLAALVAVEQGRVCLDDAAGPPGSTVRHLLAHASGLDVASATVRAAPGERRIYSNAGYEALAEVVSAAVGLSFDRWLADAVTGPLGMTATTLDGSPAAGMVGPLVDLVMVAKELACPTLVSGVLASTMRAVAFPGLGGLLPGFGFQPANDWGLGPEVRGRKAPHWTGTTNSASTFGHFGASGAFLWIDPVQGVACAALTATDFGPWSRGAWPALSDAVLTQWGSANPVIPPP